jgi:hypothetical protein
MGGEAGGTSGSGGGTGANTSAASGGGGGSADTQRLEKWGSCWNRYYELQTEYFMSSTSRHILERLTQDYLWMRTLSSSSNNTLSTRKDQLSAVNKQFRTAFEASTSAIAPIVSTSTVGGGGSSSSSGMGAATAASTAPGGGSSASGKTRSGEGSSGAAYSQVRAEQGFAAMAVGGGGGSRKSSLSSSSDATAALATNPRTFELHKAVDQLATLALEEMCEQTLQRAKIQVFGGSMM